MSETAIKPASADTQPPAPRAPIAIVILTKNEELNLPHALASVAGWAEQVFVVDSGSTDATKQITEQYSATFVPHAWEGYARQKNWALDNLPIHTPWVFILDADESITPPLRDEITRIARENKCSENSFYINRTFIFMRQRIRHSGYYPSWNIRFFRHGKAHYEQREVHEHMIAEGKHGYLKGEMDHEDRRGLAYFIAKHNEYSTLEARELFRIQRDLAEGRMKFQFWGGGPIERRRWIKHRIWPKVPARWFARWFYMYILRMGIMDGRAGFHLCLFLAGYEHQISVKLDELWKTRRRGSELPPVPAPPPLREDLIERAAPHRD